MKTLGRIVIILLVAMLVVGGTYALLQTHAAQGLVVQPMSGNGFQGQFGQPDFANGQGAPAVDVRGGDHQANGGSWTTVVSNLVEMIAVIAAVQGVWSIGRWIKRSAEKHQRLQLNQGH